jgi:hypothetical protein
LREVTGGTRWKEKACNIRILKKDEGKERTRSEIQAVKSEMLYLEKGLIRGMVQE